MNEAKLNEFMGKLVTDMGGAAMMASVILGEELGLYRAMADGDPITPEQLAERTRCNPRLSAGVAQRPGGGGVRRGTRRAVSPAGGTGAWRWRTRTRPSIIAGGASVLASMFLDKDKVVSRHAGQRRARRGATTIRACSRAPSASSDPATAPPGRRVAASARRRCPPSSKPARASRTSAAGTAPRRSSWRRRFPTSTFFGFDFHGPSIDTARERAAEAGVADRTTFEVANAKELPGPRLRPGLLLRLPPRHGRPGRRGAPRPPDARAGRDRAARRAVRRRSARATTPTRSAACSTRRRRSSARPNSLPEGRTRPGRAGWRTAGSP